MPEKRSIKDLINGLVDKDGIKTEVTVTLTNSTLTKIVLALLASGATIVIVAHVTKNLFPNHQTAALQADISAIKSTFKNHIK